MGCFSTKLEEVLLYLLKESQVGWQRGRRRWGGGWWWSSICTRHVNGDDKHSRRRRSLSKFQLPNSNRSGIGALHDFGRRAWQNHSVNRKAVCKTTYAPLNLWMILIVIIMIKNNIQTLDSLGQNFLKWFLSISKSLQNWVIFYKVSLKSRNS